MVETPRRVTAQIVSSRIFSSGEFVSEDNFSSYILFEGKKVFKLNIIGVVVSKNEGSSFVSFMIDDGFGQCEVRAFGEVDSFGHIIIGSVVQVVGRPRKWQENVYLNCDVITLVNPLWAKHRKVLLSSTLPLDVKDKKEDVVEKVIEEVVVKKPVNIVEKIISAIKELDSGDGADIDDIINNVGSGNIEEFVDKLVEQGEVFEFKPGRIKCL